MKITKLSSKHQITITKELRDKLGIRKGDFITLEYSNKEDAILVKKLINAIDCVACRGSGKLKGKNGELKECFVCRGTGNLKAEYIKHLGLFVNKILNNFENYNVSFEIRGEFVNKLGKSFNFKFKLSSNEYDNEELQRIEKELNKLINENTKL